MAPLTTPHILLFALTTLLPGTALAAPRAEPENAVLQKRLTQTYSGCYSSSNGLTEVGNWTYQSTGYCGEQCTDNGNQAVLGLTSGADCYCGNELPPLSAKVDDSSCNVGCTGYGTIMCGGDGFWSVYLTGTESNVAHAESDDSSDSSDSSSTSSASSATSTPSTTQAPQTIVTSIAPGTTIVVTQPAAQVSTSALPPKDESSGGSNTAGIAAGVVVGVVAVAAIVGGVFFCLRRRRQKMVEEEYKRSTQVNEFMRGTDERKPPGTSYSQASDTRLDPVFGAKRNSVGSMADSQDYSRRILRVANPDGN